jgi:hypothetical protein
MVKSQCLRRSVQAWNAEQAEDGMVSEPDEFEILLNSRLGLYHIWSPDGGFARREHATAGSVVSPRRIILKRA